MKRGWIKLHRKILDSAVWLEPLHLRAFLWLLLSANHKPRKVYIRNLKAEVTVGKGEIITSYRAWAEGIKHRESKRGNPWKTPSSQEMRTIRNHLEDLQIVTGVATEGCLHLRIENYELYQSDTKKATGVATGVPTEVQRRSNTEQECKNERSIKYGVEIEEIIEHLNALKGSSYRPATKETIKLISGRLSQGYTVEDCKLVVSHKCGEWKDNPSYRKFIRPKTLFAESNFEDYLNNAKDAASEEEIKEMPDESGY